ncbi:MAG: arsenate reductase ArsC [Pseudomonadota bacterium]|jgi:protein-tyrosine-phosphatase|nr:arsenate reductase ArsC [Pseudomonadota bacterium]
MNQTPKDIPRDGVNVLILCTGNSARSILGEAILNELGRKDGRLHAWSAGSHPRGQVHPMALAELRRRGIATERFRSKSWDEFSGPEAPRMDYVITVCDQAAGETCPYWPGAPLKVHMGLPDPAAVAGAEAQAAAFTEAYDILFRRLRAFAQLPLESRDHAALAAALREIATLT